ncbi:MAG: septum site-determining protein MinC [Firmicutes bacterium]|nr:septum site-determining protein MinC [Bacillota bacterium]
MRVGDVVFRGTRDGMLIVIPKEREFEEIKRRLNEKLAGRGRFFAGGRVIIDLGDRWASEKMISELIDIIEGRGLTVLKIVGPFGVRLVGGADVTMPPQPPSQSQPYGAEDPSDIATGNTLLVKRTLRSGQGINHSGNVVVLGDVNPGAEVIAGGDIIVMGTLRGVAHAGVMGNEDAIVVALRLLPTQLRVANVIARAPDERAKGPNVPEVARIRDGMIVIESYLTPGGRVEF